MESNYAAGDEKDTNFGIYDNNTVETDGEDGDDTHTIYDNNYTANRWSSEPDYMLENPLFDGTSTASYNADSLAASNPGFAYRSNGYGGNYGDTIYEEGGSGQQITTRERDMQFQELLDSIINGTGTLREGYGGLRRNIGPEDVGKRVSIPEHGEGILRYFGVDPDSGKFVCGIELDGFTGNTNGTQNVRITA